MKRRSEKELTPLEYQVMRKDATEEAFHNAYWNHKAQGLYVDRLTGHALFHSRDKYDSGTGWPSFTRPVSPGCVETVEDRSSGRVRTEVRSTLGDNHLGHVFNDGPPPGGLRYCINSAALDFVPRENLGWALLGGGCFWGVQYYFSRLEGVLCVETGFAGGEGANPSYAEVSTGETGHIEVCEILFNPEEITYGEILAFFFRLHDPTSVDRQGADRGPQYRSVIFYGDEEQKGQAVNIRDRVEKSGYWPGSVATEIRGAQDFYRASEEHQHYYAKKYAHGPEGPICHTLIPPYF